MMHKRDKADTGASLALHSPFWRFSLRLYARPGVAEECLRAQSALGIDVNVLLFCAWVGAAKAVRLEAHDVAELTARVAPWHHSVVKGLRAARQALKPLPEMQHAAVQNLRKSIAADELRAEQIEQALLFAALDPAWVPDRAASTDDIVRANVGRFLALEGGGGVSCPRLIDAAAALAQDAAT